MLVGRTRRVTRSLALVVLVASAACSCFAGGCKSKPKVDERARALPAGGAVDLGVEARYRVREVPLVGCDGGACKVTLAIDTESGKREAIVGIELPENVTSPEQTRAAILRGDLVAVGAVQQRFRADTLQGRATPPDAGANDLLLYVRDTASAAADAHVEAAPLELAARSCAGYDQGLSVVRVDDTHVYWSACGGIYRVSKNGGPPQTIATKTGASVFEIDDGYVYWSSSDAFALVKTPKAGGEWTVLVPDGMPQELASDATSLYFFSGVIRTDTTQIDRVAKAGGPATVLASTDDFLFAPAVDDTSVYFVATTRASTISSIEAVKKGGGPIDKIAKGSAQPDLDLVNPRSLVPSGDEIYWANWCAGCPIASKRKSGIGFITDHAWLADNGLVQSISISGDDLYFTGSSPSVFRLRKDGPPRHFAAAGAISHRNTSSTVAVDATSVYSMRQVEPESLAIDVLTRQPR